MAINDAVRPALQALSNTSFTGTTASIMEYAAAIADLDVAQQEAVLSTLGLNEAQASQVLSLASLISISGSWTVGLLADKVNIDKDTLAKALNAKTTDQLTASMLRAAVVSKNLNKQQIDAIANALEQASANTVLSASFDKVGLSAKAAAGLLANPATAITLLIGLLPLAITLFNKLYDRMVVTAEEAREAADEHRQSYEDLTQEADDLNKELKENKARIEELQALSDNGTITLIENEEYTKQIIKGSACQYL